MSDKGFDQLVRENTTGKSMFEPADESVTVTLTREQWKLLIEGISAKLMTTPIKDITSDLPIIQAAAEISATCRYGSPF